MGTFSTISQNGGTATYTLQGQNITNHEVWAFTLQSTPFDNIGVLISNITVFINPTRYQVTLSVVDQDGNVIQGGSGGGSRIIRGNFESTGV